MNWYRYTPNTKKYENFCTRDYSDSGRLSFFRDASLAATWTPIRLADDRGRRTKPRPWSDFPYVNTFTPLFSEKAWQALRPLIEFDVEALPVTGPDDLTYFAIHALRIVPGVLDRERSRFSLNSVTQTVTWVSKYVLVAAAIPAAHFFKLEEARGVSVFVSDQFRAAVEGAKLVGLEFTPVETS